MFITATNGRRGAELSARNSDESPFEDELLVDKLPLGFAGGDINLYRFVGSDPVDNADPSGLSIMDGTKTFFGNLRQKVSPDEQKILDALQQNQTFKDLIAYLQRCDLTYQFIVDPNLSGTIGGKSLPIPGETSIGRRGVVQISINPSFKYPGKDNPAEIANTIIHELIHAALICRSKIPKLRDVCPLNASGANDILHDPKLRDLDGKLLVNFPVLVSDLPNYPQGVQDQLNNQYGPEPLYPNLLIGDINNAAAGLINGAIADITGKAGVGGPTMTRVPK